MPVENAATVWPESESLYQTVARIRVKPQAAWSEARSRAVDDGLMFSPWHGLAAHRPLGGIMRSRKQAYEMGKRFRAERNGHTITEPRCSGRVWPRSIHPCGVPLYFTAAAAQSRGAGSLCGQFLSFTQV